MPGHARGVVSKPKNSKAALKNFLVSLKPYLPIMVIGCICAIISSVLAVFGPKILGEMTTSATESVMTTGKVDWDPIVRDVILLAIIFLVSAIMTYIEHYITAVAATKYTKEIRTRILEKISRLPISYFDKHQFGDTLSRMSNDVDVLATTLSQETTEIISSITTVVGILVMMISISVSLSIVAIITVPVSLFVITKVARRSQKLFRAQRETLGKLNSRIEEDYSGQLIIKANSHEDDSIASFKKTNQTLYEQSWKSQFLASISFPATHFFTNLGYVIICILGGNYVISGKILIGNLQAFIQYVGQFTRPITNVSEIVSNIQMTLAASERIFDFLGETEEVKDPIKSKIIEKISGAVSFENVNFSYDGKKEIIKNFSVDIKPGQQVAIVGPTGAGKTTLINLLMRFYEPTSGDIKIDGISTKDMKRSDVRKLFGMVLQDTWLFSGTIEENLRYGNQKATLADVRKATKITNVDHFVESLPECYKTKISENSDNVSAGEKQLLTIARAIIANPPMIILDEATSNVDTRTEQLIQDAFDKLTKNRTSFVIAHRLSTIRNADLILVMKNGNIVEQGNHETLLKQNGFYAELYNSQFSEN